MDLKSSKEYEPCTCMLSQIITIIIIIKPATAKITISTITIIIVIINNIIMIDL